MQKKIEILPHTVYAQEIRLNSNHLSSFPVNTVLSQEIIIHTYLYTILKYALRYIN